MLLRFEEFRILVVDPDPLAADELSDSLRSHGYSVRATYGADAALTTAEMFRPHAVISEIVMPGINGIDLANRLAECLPDSRILLTSASESVVEVMEDAVPADVLTFLRKPLQTDDVLQFLGNYLAAG